MSWSDIIRGLLKCQPVRRIDEANHPEAKGRKRERKIEQREAISNQRDQALKEREEEVNKREEEARRLAGEANKREEEARRLEEETKRAALELQRREEEVDARERDIRRREAKEGASIAQEQAQKDLERSGKPGAASSSQSRCVFVCHDLLLIWTHRVSKFLN